MQHRSNQPIPAIFTDTLEVSLNKAGFKEDDITTLVKGFDFGDKKGLGILFVCEAMSKSGKAGAYWVTFIDMKAKKVLLTERMEGKTGMSFGFRNYWTNPIKKVLDDIEDDKFKAWKAKYQ